MCYLLSRPITEWKKQRERERGRGRERGDKSVEIKQTENLDSILTTAIKVAF